MRRLIAFSLLASVFLATGCKKDEPTPPSTDRSFLHIVSVVPNDTFNLTFDYFNADDVVIKDFVYGRNFPIVGYADMLASGQPDAFGNGKLYLSASKQPFLDIKPDTVMPPRDLILEKDEKSTVCIADSAGVLRFLKTKDEFSFPNDTTNAVRFINLSNNQATASLSSTNGNISISGIDFWKNSAYSNYPHGQYDMELKDSNGTVLSTLSLWISGNTAYTFFAVGNTLGYFTN